MQFLKTVFWVLIAVVVALFARSNWSDVTLNLWGDIQADIRLPILLLIVFLIGFLPTWLIHASADLVAPPPHRCDGAQSTCLASDGRWRRGPGAGDLNPIFVAIDTPIFERATSARRKRPRRMLAE